jgi:hypothetical protein
MSMSDDICLCFFLCVHRSQMTPLLLACSSGALSSVKRLISLGASLLRQDKHGNGVVHLSAMHYHTNILEHFIECSYDEIGVWTVLVRKLTALSL